MTLDNVFDTKARWRLNLGYYAGYASIPFTQDGGLWDGWFAAYTKPGKQAQLASLLLSVYHRSLA